MNIKSKMATLLACALMLGACASNTSSDNTLASVDNDKKIIASDVYNDLMKSSSGKTAIYQYIIKEIVINNHPATDAMATEADLAIEQIQNQYTSYYGAQADVYLSNALSQSGFKSLDDYRETMIYSFQLEEFLNAYIENHFDEVFEDYYKTKTPRYVSHILVKMEDPDKPTEEEQKRLNEVQKLIDDGVDFAQIAKDYSDDGSANTGGQLGICDKDTSFVTSFKEVALKLKEGEISKATKSEYGYHFITVTSTNKEEMKKDPQVTDELLTSYDDYMLYVALQNYELTFENPDIEKIFTTELEKSLASREASRKEAK